MEIKNLINGLGTYEKASLEKTERERQKSKDNSAEEISSRGDTVNISDEALLRTEALQTASSTSDIRQDKVNAIKAQIANGEYVIDTRKIAANLLRDDLELLVG